LAETLRALSALKFPSSSYLHRAQASGGGFFFLFLRGVSEYRGTLSRADAAPGAAGNP
jgi:hypothetical protein